MLFLTSPPSSIFDSSKKQEQEIELALQLAKEAEEKRSKFVESITSKVNQQKHDYWSLRAAVRTTVDGGKFTQFLSDEYLKEEDGTSN